MSSVDWNLTGQRLPDTKSGTDDSRRSAAFHAIAAWLGRVLADSGRAWALMAGVPPYLYD